MRDDTSAGGDSGVLSCVKLLNRDTDDRMYTVFGQIWYIRNIRYVNTCDKYMGVECNNEKKFGTIST